MKMKPEIRDQWARALESGNYAQGTRALRSKDNEYCCLGVLCDLADRAGVCEHVKKSRKHWYGKNLHTATLPAEVLLWSGLKGTLPALFGHDGEFIATYAYMNDEQRKTFVEMAKLIREYA